MTFVQQRTEERPVYFEFRKSDIVSHHPTMANPRLDPFPDARPDEIVRTEIIGRELVLFAKIKGPSSALSTGTSISLDGRTFAIKKLTENLDFKNDISIFDVEGSCFLTKVDPLETLRKLRAMFSDSISKRV